MPLLLHWTDRNDTKGTTNYDILVGKNKDNFRISDKFWTQDRLITDEAWLVGTSFPRYTLPLPLGLKGPELQKCKLVQKNENKWVTKDISDQSEPQMVKDNGSHLVQ